MRHLLAPLIIPKTFSIFFFVKNHALNWIVHVLAFHPQTGRIHDNSRHFGKLQMAHYTSMCMAFSEHFPAKILVYGRIDRLNLMKKSPLAFFMTLSIQGQCKTKYQPPTPDNILLTYIITPKGFQHFPLKNKFIN